jgi:hypothetical protein
MAQTHSSTSSVTIADPHERDIEAQKMNQKKPSHWQLVIDQIYVTEEVLNWPYKGSGTEKNPYVVEYITNDRRNPMLFSQWKKWMITLLVALVSLNAGLATGGEAYLPPSPLKNCFTNYDWEKATLAVAFVSSAYSGSINQKIMTLDVGQ